jgi:hypothetical protein
VGDATAPGVKVELADGVKGDIAELTTLLDHKGKPRFRLIYRNEPTDGAPAKCLWLAIGPRAGLRAHRKAQQRSR